MTTETDIMSSLLDGLPRDDKVEVLESIRHAYGEQLEATRHPRRRRRRNEDGLLEPLPDEPSSDE